MPRKDKWDLRNFCDSCGKAKDGKYYYFSDNTALCQECYFKKGAKWAYAHQHSPLFKLFAILKKKFLKIDDKKNYILEFEEKVKQEKEIVQEIHEIAHNGYRYLHGQDFIPPETKDQSRKANVKKTSPDVEPNICFKCKKDLGGLDKYVCKFCHKPFCGRHRIPEDHDCDGNPQKPKDFKSSIIKG